MPVRHKLTLAPNPDLELITAIRVGLAEAGQYLLAQSDALAPVEEGTPRHGIHGIETGFSTVIPGIDTDIVAVGYRAFWMVWQEEDLTYHHPRGQAKFLETGMLTGVEQATEIVAENVRKGFTR